MREFKIALLKEKVRLLLAIEQEFNSNNKNTLNTLNRVRKRTIELTRELELLLGEKTYLLTEEHLKLEGKI